jgi:hypothetical protein
VASGADGLAGLSAVSGGGGAVAQPAKRRAMNGIEYRFIICLGDRFQKLELEFHSARHVALDRQPGRLDTHPVVAQNARYNSSNQPWPCVRR